MNAVVEYLAIPEVVGKRLLGDAWREQWASELVPAFTRQFKARTKELRETGHRKQDGQCELNVGRSEVLHGG